MLLVVPWFLLKLVTSTGNVAIGMTGLVVMDPVVDVVVTVADGMVASSKPTIRESINCSVERGSVGKGCVKTMALVSGSVFNPKVFGTHVCMATTAEGMLGTLPRMTLLGTFGFEIDRRPRLRSRSHVQSIFDPRFNSGAGVSVISMWRDVRSATQLL